MTVYKMHLAYLVDTVNNMLGQWMRHGCVHCYDRLCHASSRSDRDVQQDKQRQLQQQGARRANFVPSQVKVFHSN